MSTGANRACPKCGSTILTSGGACHACLLEVGLLDDLDHSAAVKTGSWPAAPSDERPARREFGDYELLEELGRGGQGVVYRARQKSLNRIVALKVIAIGQWASGANLKRFRLEAEAAARLEHPNIVPIYEIGERDSYCYFSMKFVEGGRLDQVVQREPMSLRRAAELVAKLARTVHYAHEHGLLHRDIKPANILLDGSGEPHLTDFGLAKLVEKESTVTHTLDVLGTPSYMSPEQASGQTKQLSTATDVYGLGAVLYQLLTGGPPFAGGTTYETIRQVLETEPRRPSLWNPKLDRDLEVICLKCMEKNAARRYADALQFAEDLERWLRHEPIRARSSSAFTRIRKWVRRNPAPAVLFPALAALATAIAVIVWQRESRSDVSAGLAVVLRSADTNSMSLAKECSRELNHLLSRVPALEIVPRSRVLKWESSTASAENIGQSLGAKLVLLGTFERRDDSFTLNLELADSQGGTRLWSRSWTGVETDWPSIQTQIARDVVTRLKVTLTEKEQSLLRRPLTTNQDALREYLHARSALDMLTEASFTNALHLFEAAIQHDPNFAQAHAGLADTHIFLGYSFHEPTEHFRKARLSINTALELDDTLPEAKIADGLLKYFYEWDWQGAEQAVDEALRLDPSVVEASGCYLHAQDVLGKGDEALRQVQRAFAMHPSSLQIQSELACAAYYAGHFDQAEAYCRENLKTDPENALVFWSLGRTLAQKLDYTNALKVLRTAKARTGGEWPGIDGEIGYVLARQGATHEARSIIAQLRERERREFVDPYIYAMIYAGLGEASAVFEHLNRACDMKTPWIASLPTDPKFAALRGDPGYKQILVRMKLR